MDHQLWHYLDRADRRNSCFMAFIYAINIIISLSILIPGIIDNFKPSFFLEIDDIHVAMAMMYMTMNFIFLHQIFRHRDEHHRSYLLICYVVFTVIDIVAEQVILIFLLRDTIPGLGFFGRGNIYYIATNIIVVGIYLNRYISLHRKYKLAAERE